jgi:hypothetical protein
MKDEAERRLAICVENKCGKITSKNTCKICGCYLPAKTYNRTSHCPLSKW